MKKRVNVLKPVSIFLMMKDEKLYKSMCIGAIAIYVLLKFQ